MAARVYLTNWQRGAALIAVLAISACAAQKPEQRPREKPQVLRTKVLTFAPTDGETPAIAELANANIDTDSGGILILHPDGSVSEMDLDNSAVNAAFALTPEDLEMLNGNLDIDLSGENVSAVFTSEEVRQAKLPSAQDLAIAAFAERTSPALPAWEEGRVADADDFIGASVERLSGGDSGEASDLANIVVNLRQGVDDDLAFSYATCALAGWAEQEGTGYARHVRSLSDERNGKRLFEAAYILSDEKPLGLRVMETENTLRECKARGIPAG